MIKLTNRLKAVAELVAPCDAFADIGTDHAYLPAWLIQNGVVRRAVAADIHKKPLENAQKTISLYGLENQIELRLSDGFAKILPEEAEEIAVAGMGGEQIAAMIENTPWLKAVDKHLILQPMTHYEDVRRALCENGFSILCEKTVTEGERVYLVISARYTGAAEEKPEWYYYAGKLTDDPTGTNDLLLQKILKRLKKRAVSVAPSDPETAEHLESIIKELENERRKHL